MCEWYVSSQNPDLSSLHHHIKAEEIINKNFLKKMYLNLFAMNNHVSSYHYTSPIFSTTNVTTSLLQSKGACHLVAIAGAIILIAKFMGPTWGPSGADSTQMGPMLAPWTLLSTYPCILSCSQAPIDEIYRCPIFKWVAVTWLKKRGHLHPYGTYLHSGLGLGRPFTGSQSGKA